MLSSRSQILSSSSHSLLNQLNFHPFQFDDNRHLLNNKNIDPDNNFFNCIDLQCKYYEDHEFVRLEGVKGNSSTFSIIPLNCRSIGQNFAMFATRISW